MLLRALEKAGNLEKVFLQHCTTAEYFSTVTNFLCIILTYLSIFASSLCHSNSIVTAGAPLFAVLLNSFAELSLNVCLKLLDNNSTGSACASQQLCCKVIGVVAFTVKTPQRL